MKIACLDYNAIERAKTVKIVQEAFAACQKYIGHLTAPVVYSVSPDQLSGAEHPDVFVIGPALSTDRAYVLAKEVSSQFGGVSVVALISDENYVLSNLSRLGSVTTQTVAVSDNPVRLVHSLREAGSKTNSKPRGRIVAVKGVKGGVGASTLCAGFAHAAESLDLTSVVLDLSRGSSLSLYLNAEATECEDYRNHTQDFLVPAKEKLLSWVTTCPNGIKLLPPPASNGHFRDKWLGDPSLLDINITILDLLAESFDVVIVDLGHAEGVFPFALLNRADNLLLATSNDAASAYHLFNVLGELRGVVDPDNVQVIVNALYKHGLTYNDIKNFMQPHAETYPNSMELDQIPHDFSGGLWVGTGNSFYTEAAPGTQDTLSQIMASITERPVEHVERALGFFSRMRMKMKSRKETESGKKLLAAPQKLLVQPKQPDNLQPKVEGLSLFTEPTEEDTILTH